MRKAVSGYENVSFLCATLAILLASGLTFAFRSQFVTANDRIQYGLGHLPAALLEIAVFVAIVGAGRALLSQRERLQDQSTAVYMAVLVVVFGACWLPVVLAGGFVQDDWMLLAAASVRKIIYLHPSYSWYALDSVDGNFRPLGTVLYFGYMLKWFGMSAHAFLAGSFLLNLLGCLVAFFVVRELGYSKIAGAAASLLYMSRGMIYTIVSWASALGDAIVILLCGLMALFILKANKRSGMAAGAFHLLAWVCFLVATLGKQSSFAAPLIVALLLFLRPGVVLAVSLGRRWGTAALGLVVYSGTAAVIFLHAKALLQAQSPYPISFSVLSLLRSFSYVTWYFVPLELPPRLILWSLLSAFVGLVILAGLALLVIKVPRVLGERPKNILFALLAGLASLSLFIVLGTRIAPYYGSMAAFWISIALAIGLTRFGSPRYGTRAGRIACFLFCVLLAAGFADIRIKQTGLISSGGYTWGTFGMDRERQAYADLTARLTSPAKVVVLQDFPGDPSYYASMVVLSGAKVERTLIYDSTSGIFRANDLDGRRPKNDLEALHDPAEYNWKTPVDPAAAAPLASSDQVIWLRFRSGKIERVVSMQDVVP